MPGSLDAKKEEFNKTQAEYTAALQEVEDKANKLTRCVKNYFFRRQSKCVDSGILASVETAVAKAGVLERERDQLASEIPEDVSTVRAMHSNCKQEAKITEDMMRTVQGHNIFYWFSADRKNMNKSYSNQLYKCAELERKQQKMEGRR